MILYGFNGFAYDGIPNDLVEKLKELKREYQPFKFIEFFKEDGWSIFYNDNAYSWSGIPSKAGAALTKWHDDGETFGSIAFTSDGGWVALMDYDTGTRHWETRASDGSKRFPTIHAYVHNFGDLYNRNLIIGKALTAFHTEYREPRIASNSYEISKNAYFIDGEYWKLCNIEAHPRYGPRELLWYQLETLRLPNSSQEDDDEGPPFPELHIYPFSEANDIWGHSYLNQVLIKYIDNITTRRTGDFSIFLNTYHVGESGHGTDPYVWSMVIGHESLHNLGHEHGLDNYTDARQINCFHRAMFCDGRYDGKRNVPGFG